MLKTILFLVVSSAIGASVLASHSRTAQGDSTKKSSDLNVGASNADRLEIKVPLGQVVLIADGSRDLTVHAVRSTKTPLDEQARKWMNDSYLTADNKHGVLTVTDHPFGKDSLKDLNWDDKQDHNHNGRDLNLELQIHVPASLAAKLSVTAGTANVRGQFRSIDASMMAGTVSTDRVICDGKMDLHVGAGKIDANLDNRSAGASSIRVGAGEVKVSIPSGADTEVSADVALGEITGLPESGRSEKGMHLGDKRHGRLGQGDKKLDIHVGTGSIAVKAAEKLQVVALAAGSARSERSDDSSDLDRDISEIVREAMSTANKAIESIPHDMDFDIDKGQLGHGKSLDDLGPALKKALAEIRPAIEKAMKKAKPEIEKALQQARKAIEEATKELERTSKDHGND